MSKVSERIGMENMYGSQFDHSYKRQGCSASNEKLQKDLNQTYYL